MRRIESYFVGIDQGSMILFSDYADGGTMWTGSGPRELRRDIFFSGKFRTPPVVQVAMSMWDIDHETNLRVDISATAVTETGFTIVFRTWSDTRIARARTDWLAIGEVQHDEDIVVD